MEESSTRDSRSKSTVRLIFTAAFVLLGLWFAYTIITVLFLFFFAVVIALILNAPTMWLVSKKIPRTIAALMVFIAMLLFLGLIGWLVIPKVLDQSTTLMSKLPTYYEDLKGQLSNQLADYPTLQKKLLDKSNIEDNLPSTKKIIANVGWLSFSVVGGAFVMVLFFSIIIYILINPSPLIESYLLFFKSEKRHKAAMALGRASKMMVGWMWSNLVVGTMEAIAVFFFLSFMNVPGVWVWTGLALFSEMVPKLGLYIMAVPPTLIALSINPATALWVLIFYLVLNEIMGDFVMPRIRASTMQLHPVSTLFVMLAMASAFGLVGALIATPLTAFIKAYYEEFFVSASDRNTKEHINIILERKV